MVTDCVLLFRAPAARLVDVNLAACRELGFSRSELRRLSLADIAPDAVNGNLASHIACILRGNLQDVQLKTVLRHRDSRLLPVHCSIRAVEHQPNSLLVAVAHGTHEMALVDHAAADTAARDPLTGLVNRGRLLEKLEAAAQRARQADDRYAVLFVDVDEFKAVNDSLGHLVGDQVLRAVASRLAASVRPGDMVARYGGDEFVVLMTNVHCAKSVARIAARIGRDLTTAGTLPGGKPWRVRITMSIGVALCGQVLCLPMAAIECADRAMYQAKALGRNGNFVIEDLTRAHGI